MLSSETAQCAFCKGWRKLASLRQQGIILHVVQPSLHICQSLLGQLQVSACLTLRFVRPLRDDTRLVMLLGQLEDATLRQFWCCIRVSDVSPVMPCHGQGGGRPERSVTHSMVANQWFRSMFSK